MKYYRQDGDGDMVIVPEADGDWVDSGVAKEMYNALNEARDYIADVAKGPSDLGLIVMIDEELEKAKGG